MAQRIVLLTLLLALGNGSLVYGSDSEPANALGIEYLGHGGVAVSDLEAAMHFYRDQLGLSEAFRLKRPDGSVLLIYLRVNDNNFIELFPGYEKQTQPETKRTTIRHLGLFVGDLQAALRALQAKGYPLPADAFEQARKVRADGTYLYFIKDPDGNAIELSQITPDSLQAKSRRSRPAQR